MNSPVGARRFYWLLRRELWEHPTLYLAPAAAVVAVAFIGPLTAQRGRASDGLWAMAAGLIMGASYLAALFYAVDALYGERRDRSILFWKSLPVSDLTTVASKVAVVLVIVPLLTFAASMVALLAISPFAPVPGGLVPTGLLLFYHLITVHSLWWAPLFGWLFLVSAWARRAPLVWAVLPLFVGEMVERMLLGTTHVRRLLGQRFTAAPEAMVSGGGMPIDPTSAHATPAAFISQPALWVGLLIAVVCLAAAVRLRRASGPV